ncbi:N5-glutamine methyltransferase family protein [Rhodococcus sp. ACT016]|uniref:N5-glutamine methyltransferase family protein n=1 Tax=Rhodococcus sp. ACT016 TaxID=3134808 RepID=UPI003D2A3990
MSDGHSPTAALCAPDPLVRRLRDAGCVFAEDEATILRRSATDADQLENLCARRVSGEPLEHVVGWVSFGRLRLDVGAGVFVPRQRSLLLARITVTAARARPAPIVLEAFAGVAPIAASVRRSVPHAEVHAAEVDAVAAGYARRNLGADAGVYCGAGFTAVDESLRGRVDVVAAVPPYVPTTAADLLPREALEHEPADALFAGVLGLDHIRWLIDQSHEWLAEDGVVVIEMNRSQCATAAEHASRAGFGVRRHHGGDGHTAVLALRNGQAHQSAQS